MTLKEKIFQIITQMGVVAKGNKGFNYTYTSKETIMVQLLPKFKKLKVMCQPSIVPNTLKVLPIQIQTDTANRYDKDGKPSNTTDKFKTEVVITADAIYRWTDLETGETLDVPWIIVGQMEDAAQAFGAGMTYCDRYFWMETLNLVSTDDVDQFRSKQKETELADIKAEISAVAKELLDKKAVTTQEIKQIIGKCDDGNDNLNKVTKILVAEKILNALKLKNK